MKKQEYIAGQQSVAEMIRRELGKDVSDKMKLIFIMQDLDEIELRTNREK